MRLVCAIATAFLISAGAYPQAQDESSRKIEGGGISVPGWKGVIDATETAAGKTVADAKFAPEAGGFHITTGPSTTYWMDGAAGKLSGSYTVSATFTEPKYMNLNTHPHPYGIVVAGNDMGTAQQTYLYCAAYGNGNFIVRGFGPDAFQMNGRRGEANAAVHKAAGPGEPVTQQIAVKVDPSHVTCNINGTDVATYDVSALVTPGKLKATDGFAGLRFAHNTEVMVSKFSVSSSVGQQH